MTACSECPTVQDLTEQVKLLIAQVNETREIDEGSWMKVDAYISLSIKILSDNSGSHNDTMSALLGLAGIIGSLQEELRNVRR